MQILQAGEHQLVSLEIDADTVRQIITEAGLTGTVQDSERMLLVELNAPDRDGPLLMFDAADPANTGWFSRCHFYVDGRTGAVLQTPFTVAHRYDSQGRPLPRELALQIRKELPAHFRLPGRQAVSEKVLYTVLYNFIHALVEIGVGVCGVGSVRPLAGRAAGTESQA